MTSDFNCRACGKDYSEVTRNDGGAVPTIRGAVWCFSGPHATRALPASDKRRITKGRVVSMIDDCCTQPQLPIVCCTVALQVGPNLQRELDGLPSDVETLTVTNPIGCSSPGVTLNPQPNPLQMLTALQLVDVCFEKICLTADTAPHLHSLLLSNVPDKCDLQVSLPRLRCVTIHHMDGHGAMVSGMLLVATQLETFESFKLRDARELTFASNALTSVHLGRSDSIVRLTLWAPQLRSLRLQGCGGFEQLQLIFLKTHALEEALPTGYMCGQPLEVNTQNTSISNAAKSAVQSHPRVESFDMT